MAGSDLARAFLGPRAVCGSRAANSASASLSNLPRMLKLMHVRGKTRFTPDLLVPHTALYHRRERTERMRFPRVQAKPYTVSFFLCSLSAFLRITALHACAGLSFSTWAFRKTAS